MISVFVPATSGEIIQGLYNNQKAIISLPIDMYNEVVLFEGKQVEIPFYMKKAKKLFDENFNTNSDHLCIKRLKNIISSKGLASSTADIIGTIKALSIYHNIKLNNKIMGKIAAKIEPTDASFFGKIILYNSDTGYVYKELTEDFKFKIYLFVGKKNIETTNFNKIINKYSKEDINFFDDAFSSLINDFNYNKVIEYSTKSAIINQKFLKYEKFNDIIKKIKYLCIGHTGNVIGVYTKKDRDILIKEYSMYDYVGEFNAGCINLKIKEK